MAAAASGEYRWLKLRKVQYLDTKGVPREWEVCDRTTRQEGEPAAEVVAIFATVHEKGVPCRVPIVYQYRYAVNNYVLELPAGLADPGESPCETALRELKEETGYTGRVLEISPLLAADAGLSSVHSQLAVCEIDLSLPANRHPSPSLEDTENLTVILVDYSALHDELLEIQKEKDCIIDAQLYHFARALKASGSLTQTSSTHYELSTTRVAALALGGIAIAVALARKFAQG